MRILKYDTNKIRKSLLAPNLDPKPDYQTQLEDLLGEVFKQEKWEKDHPYTVKTSTLKGERK